MIYREEDVDVLLDASERLVKEMRAQHIGDQWRKRDQVEDAIAALRGEPA